MIEEHPSETRLVINSQHQYPGWSSSTALRFRDTFYRLIRFDASGGKERPFLYHFSPWPDAEMIRRAVDYHDSATGAEGETLGRKLRRMSGKKEP